MKHGGKVVFFGRFVAVLRAWAAFLAGTNRMRWPAFLVFNALGGILWAFIYGTGAYFLGHNIHRFTGPFGIATLVLGVLAIIASLIFISRNERRLEDEAEKALPGPLDDYQTEEKSGLPITKPPTPGISGYRPMAEKTYHADIVPPSSLPGRPPGVLVHSWVWIRRTTSCVCEGAPAKSYSQGTSISGSFPI